MESLGTKVVLAFPFAPGREPQTTEVGRTTAVCGGGAQISARIRAQSWARPNFDPKLAQNWPRFGGPSFRPDLGSPPGPV